MLCCWDQESMFFEDKQSPNFVSVEPGGGFLVSMQLPINVQRVDCDELGNLSQLNTFWGEKRILRHSRISLGNWSLMLKSIPLSSLSLLLTSSLCLKCSDLGTIGLGLQPSGLLPPYYWRVRWEFDLVLDEVFNCRFWILFICLWDTSKEKVDPHTTHLEIYNGFFDSFIFLLLESRMFTDSWPGE